MSTWTDRKRFMSLFRLRLNESACHRSDVSIGEVKTVRLRILLGIKKADIHMKDDQWNSGTVSGRVQTLTSAC